MQQDLDELVEKANMLLKKRNFRDALELLSHAEQLALENERSVALVNIYYNIGSTFSKLDNFENAKKYLERALKNSKKLALIDPLDNELVAWTQNKLGTLLAENGRLEEAKTMLEQALEIREALLNTYPENARYPSDVAITLNNLGTLLAEMGRFEKAKTRLEQALEIREALLNTDLENAQYQSYVAITLNSLGNLLAEMGRFEKAKTKLEQALEIREALTNTDPKNVQYQSYVAGTLNNLGNLLITMGSLKKQKSSWSEH